MMPNPSQQSVALEHCELCGGRMKLVQRSASPDGQVQLACYRCERCGHSKTAPVKDES
jgi:hypothetical protein